MRFIPSPATVELLQHLESSLPLNRNRRLELRQQRNTEIEIPTQELALLRLRLLSIDERLGKLRVEGPILYADKDVSSFVWMTYLEEVKIVPIYDDAIAVMRYRPLITSEEIPNLLQFLGVSGSNYGIDKSEDHGFGFHFHFGKVKKNTLNRLNVVLTFDHTKPVPPKSHDPLFYEEHGSGRYEHIDASTVGNNVRLPVYKICESEMRELGRDKFKIPSAKALRFY